MQRLQNLESLVKELSGQLEQANAAAGSAAGGSSGVNSPSSNQDRDTDPQMDPLQKPFGRLVLQDANRSRYVGSGFWSRVDDEVRRQVMFKWLPRLANFYCSLMDLLPIPQKRKMRHRQESPHPLKNFTGHLQNGMHSCLDTT